jgi:hypothetical protein
VREQGESSGGVDARTVLQIDEATQPPSQLPPGSTGQLPTSPRTSVPYLRTTLHSGATSVSGWWEGPR